MSPSCRQQAAAVLLLLLMLMRMEHQESLEIIVIFVSHHLVSVVDGDHKVTECSSECIVALAVNGTSKVVHLHVQAVNKFRHSSWTPVNE